MKRAGILLAVLLAGCSSSSAPAPAPPADDTPTGPSLVAGAAAPALPALLWVKGDAVAAFHPGTVYVLDFWATWCTPCLATFPESAALAARFAGQKCEFVAVTAGDPRNTEGAVREFVSGRGAKYPFRWAFDAEGKAYAAYMEAARKNSIPTTFVVDRAGKLAWVGHPSELADVLPEVIAGTWDPATGPNRIATDEAALQEILAAVDEPAQRLAGNLPKDMPLAEARKQVRAAQSTAAKAAVPKLEAFAKAHPTRADRVSFLTSMVVVTLAADDPAGAKGYADRVLASDNPFELDELVDRWANPVANPTRAFPDVATAAAAKILAFDLPGPLKFIAAAKAAAFAGDTEARDKYLAAALKGVSDARQVKAIRAAVAAAE